MRAYLAYLALAVSLPARAQTVQEDWAVFLESPTVEHSRRIAIRLDQCRSRLCEPKVAPNSADVQKLNVLVETGHREAIHVAFLCRRFLDGGDLEDLTQSLGVAADTAPKAFLEEIKKHGLALRQLQSILEMVPESAMDDPNKRRRAYTDRVRILLTVKDRALRDVRDESVRVLQRALQESSESEGVLRFPRKRAMSDAAQSAAIEEFGAWFSSNADRLRNLASEQVADAVHERLQAIDDQLSVEVGNINDTRELVISAGRRVSLFPLVKKICRRIQHPGWEVQALKPPRGFNFTTTVKGVNLNVGGLYFDPLESASKPGVLGVRIYAPEAQVAAVRDAAWRILEAGIGERAASEIDHLDVSVAPQDLDGRLSLRDLGAYIDWYRKRQKESRKSPTESNSERK